MSARPEHIVLPPAIRRQLLDLALSRPHAEVCGLLGGMSGRASSFHPVTNIDPEPARRFLMEPAEQIRALRHMRESGEQMIGIFHSHPASPAQPSPTDRALACYPDVFYLILSLQDAEPELNAFYYDGNGFTGVAVSEHG